MTLAEFKAWLDGFRMAIDQAPTDEQWKLILDKLATVHDRGQDIFYVPYYTRPYPTWPTWYTTCHAEGAQDAARFIVDGTA